MAREATARRETLFRPDRRRHKTMSMAISVGCGVTAQIQA
jgi:hypothetical protein